MTMKPDEGSNHQTSINKKVGRLDASNHWRITQLGVINKCRPKIINPLDFPDEIFEYYSIPAFQEQRGAKSVRGREVLSNKFLISNHTVLFGKLNPRILKVWLVDSTSKNRRIASTEFIPIRADDDTESEFIYYLCHSDFVVSEARRLVSGSTPSRQRVDPKSFSQIYVPIPPRSEQQAIARILKSVQEAKAARQREVELERERKAALMQHLFTHGNRGDSTKQTHIGKMPVTWQAARLSEFSERPVYGFTTSALIGPTETKFLRITDIQHEKVSWDVVPYCACDDEIRQKYAVKPGDILIARIGATTGKTCLVKDAPAAIFASYLMRIRTGLDLLPTFLSFYFQTSSYWMQIDQRKGGRLKEGINIPILENLIIPLPPLVEQQEISDILQACDAKISALENEIKLLNELFAAILEELMTGKLSVKSLTELAEA
jgi:type I restriction enzyme S subunit